LQNTYANKRKIPIAKKAIHDKCLPLVKAAAINPLSIETTATVERIELTGELTLR
jgi:hypothetical protein